MAALTRRLPRPPLQRRGQRRPARADAARQSRDWRALPQKGCSEQPRHDINRTTSISTNRCPIAAVTVRQISAETHRALKARARRHGRSTEAEIRAILDDAVAASPKLGIGSALARLGRRFRGVELEIERDRTPPEPIRFE